MNYSTKKKIRNIKNKFFIFPIQRLLRKLNITKPIELSEFQIKVVKIIKNHYQNDENYRIKNTWVETFKKVFEEYIGWSADEHLVDYKNGMVNKLLSIWFLIGEDYSGDNRVIREIINAGMNRRDNDPVDQVISKIAGEIQCVSYLNEAGLIRFNLDLNKIKPGKFLKRKKELSLK